MAHTSLYKVYKFSQMLHIFTALMHGPGVKTIVTMTRITYTVYIMLAGDYKVESHAVAKETT